MGFGWARQRAGWVLYAPLVASGDGDGRAAAAAAAGEDGVCDLLGLLAYAELVAFFRLSEDASLASSLADKAALGAMAVAEFGHFEKLRDQLARMGAQPEQAMAPFVEPLDAFHARTAPSDWLEGLVKAYVGDGLAADFYRAVAEVLEPAAHSLVMEVLADTGHAAFVIPRVRAATAADPKVAGRLALWARRLVGEGLAQAHRVVASRPALANLLVAPAGGQGSQGDVGRMFARLTDAHDRRMAELGLAGAGRAECGRAARSQAAEAHPALFGAAELHVTDLFGGHQGAATVGVSHDEQAAVLYRGGQCRLDLLRREGGLDHEFPADGLNPDLDFHASSRFMAGTFAG